MVKKVSEFKELSVLEENFVNGSQSIEMVGIYEYNGHKLKIHIDRDSYNAQSNAVIYVWSPIELKWNHLNSIHNTQMAVCIGGFSNKGVFAYTKVQEMLPDDKALFLRDKLHLIRIAKQVLG